jgi:hypothetical protein
MSYKHRREKNYGCPGSGFSDLGFRPNVELFIPAQSDSGIRIFRSPCIPACATAGKRAPGDTGPQIAPQSDQPHAHRSIGRNPGPFLAPKPGQVPSGRPHPAVAAGRRRVALATPGCLLAGQSLSSAAHSVDPLPSAAPPLPGQAPAQAKPAREIAAAPALPVNQSVA